MRILLINPPHPAIGSRIPHEHLPPLGLLAIGGPLLDAGHSVRLLDADLHNLTSDEIVSHTRDFAPQAILIGHSGSTSAHPVVVDITRALRTALPDTWIIYGGVFPTYHWRDILAKEPQIDVIVRGEGEESTPRVIQALENGTSLGAVFGIAYRKGKALFATLPAPLIDDLNRLRVGWELIDPRQYSYWGDRRAVVVQFSRGCSHACTYCGQSGFWTRWRHRDPKLFAAEIARLHRQHGIEVFNFADEHPTALKAVWQTFLEALIGEQVAVILVGSTRADDIVRDADILHLYKRAGVARFLLGIESYDQTTLRRIRKGADLNKDRESIRLLRQHGILSMATYAVGFEEESDRNYLHVFRQILAYDSDQLQVLYVTPHRWTPYYRQAVTRRVIQSDRRRWDYKHQVLASRHIPAWRVLVWVKFIEVTFSLRPKALWRLLTHPDADLRAAQRWYYRIGRKVWFYEIFCFIFRDRRENDGPRLKDFWGEPQDGEARAMRLQAVVSGRLAGRM